MSEILQLEKKNYSRHMQIDRNAGKHPRQVLQPLEYNRFQPRFSIEMSSFYLLDQFYKKKGNWCLWFGNVD